MVQTAYDFGDENKELSKKIKTYSIEDLNDVIYQLRKTAYEDKPVSIETFIEDSHFLGKVLNGIIYEKWKKLLKRIHTSPYINNYYEIILEAPLSSGKSYISSISIVYEIYKLLLMCDPQAFYGLGPGTRIYFIIFSVDLNSADLNWNYIKTFMQKSPWFQDALRVFKRKITQAKKLGNNEQFIGKDIYVGLGSNTDHSISRRVFGGVLDEGNFQSGGESRQAYENYEAMITRIEASFSSDQGVPPGILWLASSPTFESSFITERVQAAQGLESTLVVENIPIWVLKKNSGNYNSGKYFEVFVGDGIRDPFILTDDNKLTLSPESKVIKVPQEHYVLFKKNTAKALRDLGGRRINATTSFFKSKDRVRSLYTMPNIFTTDIIEVGMKTELSHIIKAIVNLDFFKTPMMPWAYRFIHIDIGAKIDRLGIACVFAVYKDQTYYSTPDSINERTQRFFYGEWGVTLQALENDEIPFSLVVNLFIYLKSIGFPIQLITTDQMEGGRKLRQDLTQAGFSTDYQSVDKDRAEYDTYHDLIEEERAIFPLIDDEHGLLFLETTELIDGGPKAKHPTINHPKKFKVEYKGSNRGSKDLADGYCGAINSANKAKLIFNPLIMFGHGQNEKRTKNGNMFEDLYNNKGRSDFAEGLNNNFYG